MQLRGGGCGTSSLKTQSIPEIQDEQPQRIASQIRLHSDRIHKLALNAVDETDNLYTSLQFFQKNQKHLYKLAQSATSSLIDLFDHCIQELLESMKILVKVKPQLAYWTSFAISSLARLNFQFYLTNGARYMDQKQQQKYIHLIDSVKEQINIEKQDNNFIEFELFKIHAIFSITPTNSTEGQQLALQFLGGAIKAGLTMSLNDDLIQSLKNGAIFLYKENIKRMQKRKYELIYFIEHLRYSPDIKVIQDTYENSISKTSDWEVLFAWYDTIFYIMIDTSPTQQIQNSFLKGADQLPNIMDSYLRCIQQSLDNSIKQNQTSIAIKNVVRIEQNIKSITAQNFNEQIPLLKKNISQLISSLILLQQVNIQQEILGQYSQRFYFIINNLQVKAFDVLKSKTDQFENTSTDQQTCIRLWVKYFEILLERLNDLNLNITDLQQIPSSYEDLIQCLQLTIVTSNMKQQFIQRIQVIESSNKQILNSSKQLQNNSITLDSSLTNHSSLVSYIMEITETQISNIQQIIGALKVLIDLFNYEEIKQEETLKKNSSQMLVDSSIFKQIIEYIIGNTKELYLDQYILNYEVNMKTFKDQISADQYDLLVKKSDTLTQIKKMISINEKVLNRQQLSEELKKDITNICSQQEEIELDIEDQSFQFSKDIKFFKQLQKEMTNKLSEYQEIKQAIQKLQTDLSIIEKELTNYHELQKTLSEQYSNHIQSYAEDIKILIQKYQNECLIEITIENIIKIIKDHDFQTYSKEIDNQVLIILSQLDNQQQSASIFDNLSQTINDLVTSNDWKIRQLILVRLIQLNEQTSYKEIKDVIHGMLAKVQIFETDARVKQCLNDKSLDMNAIMQTNWKDAEEQVQEQISQTLSKLNDLQMKIQSEKDTQQRMSYQKQYNQLQSTINAQVQNLSECSQLGIQVMFLQDLKQDLNRIESKINQISDTLDTISTTLETLKGRSIYDLLQIRKNKSRQESQSIYIQIQVKEYQYDTLNESAPCLLYSDAIFGEGIINEFIWKNSQNSLLLHGPAGSGKSTSSKKIEIHLWNLYDQNKGNQNYIPIVPIYVSLPSLKDPLHSIISESLAEFDQSQLIDLKNEIDNKRIRIIFILDSYDELSQQHLGQNLLITNKLSQWAHPDDHNSFPKIITSSRTEVFNSSNYYNWFIQENNTISSFREVRLLPFNVNQVQEYFDMNYQLEVHKILKSVTNVIISTKDIINQQFDSLQLSNESKIQVKKLIGQIWTPQKYLGIINTLKLWNLIQTPFMIQIFLQVLPKIYNKRINKDNIQQQFMRLYKQENQLEILDQLNQDFWTKFTEISSINEIKYLLTGLDIKADLDEVSHALYQKELTAFDFYEEFISQYFHKQILKVRANGENLDLDQTNEELWTFSQQLANEMTQRQLTQIYFKQQGMLYKKKQSDWRDQFFDDLSLENGHYKKIFRSCIPLTLKSNLYSFSHKSIQEFLVARNLISEPISIESFNTLNLSNDFNFGIAKFVLDKLDQQVLISMVKSNKKNKQFIRSLSNLMTLLCRSQYCFEKNDLSELQIEDCNLVNINLFNTMLKGSIFSNVNISYANLNFSILENINWSNILINELPYYNGCDRITQMDFYNDILVILNYDENLLFNENKKLRELYQEVSQFAIFESQKIMICFSRSKLIIHSFESSKCFEYEYDMYQDFTNAVIDNNIIYLGHQGALYTLSLKAILKQEKQDLQLLIEFDYNTQQIYVIRQWIILIQQQSYIRVYDIKANELLSLLDSDQEHIEHADFNGQLIALGGRDGTVKVLKFQNPKAITFIKLEGHSDKVFNVKFSNQILASLSQDRTIRIWDIQKNQQISILNLSQDIKSIAIKKSIIYYEYNEKINLWDYSIGSALMENNCHNTRIAAMAVNDEYAATISDKGLIKLWNSQNLRFVSELDTKLISYSIGLSNENILAGHKTLLTIWNLNNLQKVMQISTFGFKVNQLLPINDDLILSAINDSSARLYNIQTKQFKLLYNHKEEVNNWISIYEDEDSFKKVQDPLSYPLFKSNSNITCLDLNFDVILLGTENNNIEVYTDNYLFKKLDAHKGKVTAILILNDTYYVSSGSDKQIKVWELEFHVLSYTLNYHYSQVDSLIKLNDFFISQTLTEICFWQLQEQDPLKEFRGIDHIKSFTCTQSQLYYGTIDGQILQHDIRTQKQLKSCKQESSVLGLACTENMVISADGINIIIWNTSLTQLRTILKHEYLIMSIKLIDNIIMSTDVSCSYFWSQKFDLLDSLYCGQISVAYFDRVKLQVHVANKTQLYTYLLSIPKIIKSTTDFTLHYPSKIGINELLYTGAYNGSINWYSQEGNKLDSFQDEDKSPILNLSIYNKQLLYSNKEKKIKLLDQVQKSIVLVIQTESEISSLHLDEKYYYYNQWATAESIFIMPLQKDQPKIHSINGQANSHKQFKVYNKRLFAIQDRTLLSYTQVINEYGGQFIQSPNLALQAHKAIINKQTQISTPSKIPLTELLVQKNAKMI